MLDIPQHELRPLTRFEYEDLAAHGHFDDERVELLPEYWVLDVDANLIEVRTEIVAGEYRRLETYGKGARIALVHFPDVAIDTSDILR